MRRQPLEPEQYLYLQENGIDISACEIDYKLISVRCGDLSLYRKAFRVKIRSLIKQGDMIGLKRYVNQFYTLAHFVRYLYGFHSCASDVESWQETLAHNLQTKFIASTIPGYTLESWLVYKDTEHYKQFFKRAYIDLSLDDEIQYNNCIQDEKPFLNPKDKAHFDKCLKDKEQE